MGDFYPDQYIHEADIIPQMWGTSVLGVIAVIYVLVYLVAMAFSLGCYILQSLGLYTIAGRRGIKHNWLAWIPLGNLWILGSISDQYSYLTKGKIKNRRKLLLGLGIGAILLCVFWLLGMLFSAFSGELAATVLLTALGVLALLVIVVIQMVVQYMAYYDLFSSCQPGNGVLYLVLSIIFPVTLPFFVFFCRKKDLGMPPRKQPAPQPVIESAQAEEIEPEIVEEGFAHPEEFEE